MTQENQGTNSAVPDNLPVKRKRGRPRKDRSQTPALVSATPTPDTERNHQRRRIDPVADKKNEMLGQTVFGVLDGSFDAGYLLTVRVGDTDTILKGVVFQPGSSLPISVSNDVAPHIKMLKRAEMQIPQFDLHGSSFPNKKPDEAVQKSEAFLQPGAFTPLKQVPIAPIAPPEFSNSQPQMTKGGQNDTVYVALAASTALHHPEDKTKNSAAIPANVDQGSHVIPVTQSELKEESVKQSVPDASAFNVQKTEESAKTTLDQGPCSADEGINPAKPVDAALECQTSIASLPQMTNGAAIENLGCVLPSDVTPPPPPPPPAAAAASAFGAVDKNGPDTHLSISSVPTGSRDLVSREGKVSVLNDADSQGLRDV